MTEIKNIIFDLGGIIINIDYKKTEQAFIELGVTNFRQLYSQFHTTHIFEALEKGDIDAAAFFEEVKKISPVPLSSAQITQAWNAMLLDLPEGRLTFLYTLKSHYRTFLLSNTNEIHYNAIQHQYKEIMEKEYKLGDCFEQTYYSHEVNLRKPEVEIYQYVLNQHGLVGEETLFIDDTLSNVEGAMAAGLRGCYLPPEKSIETLFPGHRIQHHLISSKSI